MISSEVIYSFKPSEELSLSAISSHTRNREIPPRYTSLDGQDQAQPLPYDPATSITAQVQASFAKSLQNLGVDRINGYLLHGPLRTRNLTLEAWNAIVALKVANKVDLVGVGNVYDVKTLEFLTESSGTRPEIVQNRWYENNDWDQEVVSYCLKHRIHYEYPAIPSLALPSLC